MPHSFDELLSKQQKLYQELAHVHEKEVSELRIEIRRLQDQIERSCRDGPACQATGTSSSQRDVIDDRVGLGCVTVSTDIAQSSLEKQSGDDSDSDGNRRGSVLGNLPKGFGADTVDNERKARECSSCKTFQKDDEEFCRKCGSSCKSPELRRMPSETPSLNVPDRRPSLVSPRRTSVFNDKTWDNGEIDHTREVDLPDCHPSRSLVRRTSFLGEKRGEASDRNLKVEDDGLRGPPGRRTSQNHQQKRRLSFLNDKRRNSFLNDQKRDSVSSTQSFAVTNSQLRVMTQMSHLPLEALPLWHDIMEIHEDNDSSSSDSDDTQDDTQNGTGAVSPARMSSKRISGRADVGIGHRHSYGSVDGGKIVGRICVRLARCRGHGIHPDSLFYLGWITLGVTLIFFDLITLPMSCFDIGFLEGTFAVIFSCFVSLFWTADTCMSFFVGYSLLGEVEMKVRNIASHYLRTWFTVDLLLVVGDWVIVGISLLARDTNKQNIVLARLPLFGRAVRTIRILRLLSGSKLPGMLNELTLAAGCFDSTSLIMGVGKSVCCILFINHVIACAWFAIGDQIHGGWVAAYALESTHDWQHLYLTSLHWSLTQFTFASMDIFPQNLAERTFAMVVLLFALVSFSAFVSSITQSMTQLGRLRGTKAKQKASFEQYLRDNNISMHLCAKMRRYVDFQIRLNANGSQSEQDVEMLEKLSDTLRMELHYEVYAPWLIRHAFFQYYRDRHLPGMQRLCHTALCVKTLYIDDVLFSSGEVGQHMYIIQEGALEYKRAATAKRLERVEEIYPGPCFSELVLWATWEHRGRTVAISQSKIIALNADIFHATIMYFKILQKEISVYAIQVVKTINEMFDPLDFTDLNLGCEVYDSREICQSIFFVGARNTPRIGIAQCEDRAFSAGGRIRPFSAIMEVVSPRGSMRRSMQSLPEILNRKLSGRSSVSSDQNVKATTMHSLVP